MKLTRRSLFKFGGAAAAAVVAAPIIEQLASAPLFIPAERLEMGVPRALAMPKGETFFLPVHRPNAPFTGGAHRAVEHEWLIDQQGLTIVNTGDHPIRLQGESAGFRTIAPHSTRQIYYDGHRWREIPQPTLIEYRRSLADAIDRGYEQEIKGTGQPLRLTQKEFLHAKRYLNEDGVNFG